MGRALGRLEGVASVRAPLLAKSLVVVPASDRVVDLRGIGRALWSEGFRLRRLRIVASGEFERGGRFRIAGWPAALPVAGEFESGPARISALVRPEAGGLGLRRVRLLD